MIESIQELPVVLTNNTANHTNLSEVENQNSGLNFTTEVLLMIIAAIIVVIALIVVIFKYE